MLPQSSFPFDSYFNILPSCNSCNTRKGARTALEAGLTIHEDAYQAYADYVRSKKVPHVYHTIKKGLLNLFRRSVTQGEGERRLAMLANDLVTATASQRSPRPLARYLAGRLEQESGARPEIVYRAGRHTALYRSVLLPDYDKELKKEEFDLRNHAVDAIVLGCDLPSASALENKQWQMTGQRIHAWLAAVKAAAPDILLGLPRVAPEKAVEFFEEDLHGGYFRIDLSAFNWNRKRKATHVLDPFGLTADGRPLKRIPAAEVLAGLNDPSKRDGQIELIAHQGLRNFLKKDPSQGAKGFVGWLQKSIRAGFKKSGMSEHPADRARRQMLERFAKAPVDKVVSGEEPIPGIIGIRCLNKGSQNKLHVMRAKSDGKVFQHYQADPVVREMYVGCRMSNGQLDRRSPVILTENQAYAVKIKNGNGHLETEVPAQTALKGRAYGAQEKLKLFVGRWQEEFTALCEREGIAKMFKLTQGCVIERTDGSTFQLRNFDKTEPWMRAASFQNIRRIYRSPLQVR